MRRLVVCAALAAALDAGAAVTPLVTCWSTAPGSSPEVSASDPEALITVMIGYENTAATSTTIPVGVSNFIAPPPGDRLQPATFAPGSVPNAFTITARRDEWDAGITWYLDGTAHPLWFSAVPACSGGLLSSAGPRGATGAQGPEGARGAIGIEGIPGERGDAGANGVDGATGPAGPSISGPQGPPGAPGDTGAQGPAGDRGADGAPGAKGPPGDAGADAAPGAAGPTGPAGPRGDVGSAGVAGIDGVRGAIGPQGERGDAGPAGTPGPIGVKGERGRAGLRGEPGETGPAGATGSAGIAGALSFLAALSLTADLPLTIPTRETADLVITGAIEAFAPEGGTIRILVDGRDAGFTLNVAPSTSWRSYPVHVTRRVNTGEHVVQLVKGPGITTGSSSISAFAVASAEAGRRRAL